MAVKAPWLVPGGPTLASCMDRLKKRYSHLVGGLFLAGKAVLALSTCLTNESADYCLLVNEWTWLMSCKSACKAGSGLGFSFEVRAWTEIEIRCIKGMYRLKLVSSEKIQSLMG